MRVTTIGALLLCLFAAQPSWAKQKSVDKSTKEIDFEGEVVEGVNKQPLDSLNQLSDQDSARNKVHLYRKRDNFQIENQETIRELTETY